MSKITNSVFLALALLMLANFSIFGQVTTGSLQGIVTDQNGAVVAGATVKITNTATGLVREAQTNDEGFYRVTNLLPGDAYKIEVIAQGVQNATLENVAVRLATENNASVQLSVGGANARPDRPGRVAGGRRATGPASETGRMRAWRHGAVGHPRAI